mgnify:CR=1 FL=1
MEITKQVRQNALQCVSLRLITIARISPKKLHKNVANTAHTMVQPKPPECLAYLSAKSKYRLKVRQIQPSQTRSDAC